MKEHMSGMVTWTAALAGFALYAATLCLMLYARHATGVLF